MGINTNEKLHNLPFTKYFKGDKIVKNEIWHVTSMGETRNVKCYSENLKGRHIFGDTEVDGTVVLKWIINK
jgi:hypothetical protein